LGILQVEMNSLVDLGCR